MFFSGVSCSSMAVPHMSGMSNLRTLIAVGDDASLVRRKLLLDQFLPTSCRHALRPYLC